MKQLLTEKLLATGEEDRKLAIERGDFHQGVPAITTVVDGGWSKRCHKHSYNAKSGVAVIFGQRDCLLVFVTSTMLFVMCLRSRKEPPEHVLPQLVRLIRRHGERYCA